MNKKITLLVAAQLATIAGINAQTTAKTSVINMQQRLMQKNNVAFKEGNTPFVLPQTPAADLKLNAVNSTTLIFNAFSGSGNVYGLLSNAAKPLQYNDNINTVSFIQRKSATYTGSPANNSGVIVAMISNSWGTSWDSTCIYSDATNPGRYPQGAVYNPVGNTNIANAYVVGSGPAIAAGSWTGSWYASKQLAAPGSTLYNSTASAVPNAMQLFSNSSATYAANQGKQDFAQFGFTSTDDGIVRSLAQIDNDVNVSQTDIRGAQLVKGIFNAGVFTWTTDSFIPPVVVQPTSLEKQMSTDLYQAWNEAGTVGYVVFIGSRTGQTNSNTGWQPIVYKSTNSGATWSLLNGIDFNSTTFQCLMGHLDPVNSNPLLRIPFFNVNEGVDCIVDANNKLHIATTIASTDSPKLDSLGSVTGHGTENYTWNHTPGKRPYLYDFITDGTTPWTYYTIDSLSSEAPSSVAGGPGFTDNPWDDNAGKITSDSRIQLSRTPDGQYIVYTWAESDTNVTNLAKKWNTLPNIKARLLNVSTSQLYTTEINVTKPITGNGIVNPNVSNRAMLHYTSPKSSSATVTAGVVNLTTPITVCNSNPYSQLTNNVHYFSAAKLTFTNSLITPTVACSLAPVNIKENVNLVSNFNIMPNPAKDLFTISVDILSGLNTKIEITNALGQIVSQTNATTQQTLINIGHLNSGIYFVTVKQGTAHSTKKLIVE